MKIEPTKKIPINRNNLFYSEESYNYELMIGKNYIEQDVNQTIVLFEVDLENTNTDAIYNEAKKDEIRFKTPKEMHVLFEINDASLHAYNKKRETGVYLKTGLLNFSVYQATLDELECDIKRGDYIGVAVTQTHMEYFAVVNDGRINYDNKHTMYGYLPFYRTIECAPVTGLGEFEGH